MSVKITPTITDEVYTTWYKCSGCEATSIMEHFKYCPMCGEDISDENKYNRYFLDVTEQRDSSLKISKYQGDDIIISDSVEDFYMDTYTTRGSGRRVYEVEVLAKSWKDAEKKFDKFMEQVIGIKKYENVDVTN